MIDPAKKEAIAKALLQRLRKYTEKFPIDSSEKRNEPMHDAILKAFEGKLDEHNLDLGFTASLTSWVQGLNTSIGTFFEKVGCILADAKSMPFTDKKGTALEVTESQIAVIKSIWNDLKSNKREPNLQDEIERILAAPPSESQQAADFTVDIFIENENAITAIEMKSVRMNKGEAAGEKQKILEAKAALCNRFPDKEVKYLIGFPFDSTSDTPTGYDKSRFMNHLIGTANYFADDEFMIASELWDFLSGSSNTMEELIDIIEETVETFLGE